MVLQYGRVNLGLVLSLVGSLLSLPLGKRYHVGLGVIFTLLTAMHTWQHRNRFRHYLYKERQNMGLFPLPENILSPAVKVKLFMQQVQVLHYMPGRVRLYASQLVGNPELVRQISQHLTAIPEIKEFSLNPATGSLLIRYSPEDVARNPFLRDIEQLVVKQYGR